ncbi:10190_t:CDS:1, partial [Scutellospora calospora]
DGIISTSLDPKTSITSTILLPYEFKLLFRSSRDGFNGETFHRLCDNIPGTVTVIKINNIPGTVTVIKINNTNEILGGGYNPLIWKVGIWTYSKTADSFIFSLKNGNLNQSILSHVSNQSKAIRYGKISQGTLFGGKDLVNLKNVIFLRLHMINQSDM